MNPTVRKILAVLAGIVVAVCTISLVEWLGHQVYPVPEGLDPMKDPDGFVAYLESVPVGAKAFVVAAWTLGAFLGSFVGIKIARGAGGLVGGFVGGFVILGIAINATMFPGQWPMAVVGAILVIIAAWLAARAALPGPLRPLTVA